MFPQIEKWMKENSINFTIEKSRFNGEYIKIVVDPNHTWTNGYGETMKYPKVIDISKNSYNDYVGGFSFGNNQYEKLWCKKQSDVKNFILKILRSENLN